MPPIGRLVSRVNYPLELIYNTEKLILPGRAVIKNFDLAKVSGNLPQGCRFEQDSGVAVEPIVPYVEYARIVSKRQARVATKVNLNADYSPPSRTLTALPPFSTLVVDGVTLSRGDFVLVKNQTNKVENGHWEVLDEGSSSRPWKMRRRKEEDSYIIPETTALSEGTQNQSLWILVTDPPIQFGYTPIEFEQFTAAAAQVEGAVEVTDKFVLSALDISHKYVMLNRVPFDPSVVELTIEGAPNSVYGEDYIMDPSEPRKLTWAGLGLDGLLAPGDIMAVEYTI